MFLAKADTMLGRFGRLAKHFIRVVSVRKDGIDIIVWGDGFKKLMGKE